ncbi:hypothetical protein GCM10023215_43650 [Pseudonocardia yuanmonensis]|uniref:Uncharacterized protein n=1 Tax=Pseudonocardia yuanmonensis TaxID=1095914 RepID=A0ABP8X5L5_9PSEU
MATHGDTTNAVRVTGPIGRGTFRAADLYRVAQSVSPKTVKFVSGMGPATIAAWLVDQHYQDRKALYHICHLTAGVPVGSTPSGLFAEMVAKDLEVDACEYALAETGFPEDSCDGGRSTPATSGSGSGSPTSSAW